MIESSIRISEERMCARSSAEAASWTLAVLAISAALSLYGLGGKCAIASPQPARSAASAPASSGVHPLDLATS